MDFALFQADSTRIPPGPAHGPPRPLFIPLVESPNQYGAAMMKKSFPKRPYLRIFFQCCGVYQRVYRDRTGMAYSGRCPRCLRPIRFPIGPEGTRARGFVVS